MSNNRLSSNFREYFARHNNNKCASKSKKQQISINKIV